MNGNNNADSVLMIEEETKGMILETDIPKGLKDADLTILSPKTYQVFQRQSEFCGEMKLDGRVNSACDCVMARVVGKSLKGDLSGDWQKLSLKSNPSCFSAVITVPAGGWYNVEFRAMKGEKVVSEVVVEKVGMGEIFIGAGQSNSTNSGEETISQSTGMVSSFSGINWQLSEDPQPGCIDQSTGGSFWPALGDELFEKYGVPIGVAPTGMGGSSVMQWEPNGDCFSWMMTRIHQFGRDGFRAVLWHQGETDVEMDSLAYVKRLAIVIRESTRQAGWVFPWFVAKVSYHSPEMPSRQTTRAAHQMLWDFGIALEGPDTDVLTDDHRDAQGLGIHFSPKGLKAHGKMWAEKVGDYLDKKFNKK